MQCTPPSVGAGEWGLESDREAVALAGGD